MLKKEKKQGMWDKLIYIRQNKAGHSLLRYLKVNIFHIFFEMLITVYSMELVVVLTRFFIIDSNNIPQMFIIAVAPTLFGIIIATIFFGAFAVYYINRFYSYLKKAKSEANNFASFESDYKREVVIVHIIGILLYLFTAVGISCFIIKKYPTFFFEGSHLVFWMTIVGVVFGVMWNVTGIFRDQRILWNMILPGFEVHEIKVISTKNYRYYCENMVGSIISLLSLFSLIVFIFFTINEKLDIRVMTTDYWFLIVYYFSLIALYCKLSFTHLYSHRNKKEPMFPPLSTIIDQFSEAEEINKH